MEIWSAEQLDGVIKKLKERGRTGDEQCMMYVLNPYITSLGYDVFDIDEVDMDINTGRMRILVTDKVFFVVGLSSYLPTGETDKVFLHVDIRKSSLNLYLKALGTWEQVGEAVLVGNETKSVYPEIMRLIAKESLRRTLHEKGERLFTEGVLRRQLEQGNYDNRFVRTILEEELRSPSDGFVKLIAEGLAREYSTDNVSTLMDGLMPIKDTGLVEMFTGIIGDVQIPEKTAVRETFRVKDGKDDKQKDTVAAPVRDVMPTFRAREEVNVVKDETESAGLGMFDAPRPQKTPFKRAQEDESPFKPTEESKSPFVEETWKPKAVEGTPDLMTVLNKKE